METEIRFAESFLHGLPNLYRGGHMFWAAQKLIYLEGVEKWELHNNKTSYLFQTYLYFEAQYANVDQPKTRIQIKMFYLSYSNILFKLRQPAIFEQDDVRKSYIPQKEALNNGRWE